MDTFYLNIINIGVTLMHHTLGLDYALSLVGTFSMLICIVLQ